MKELSTHQIATVGRNLSTRQLFKIPHLPQKMLKIGHLSFLSLHFFWSKKIALLVYK
jgi:hypothetical protein